MDLVRCQNWVVSCQSNLRRLRLLHRLAFQPAAVLGDVARSEGMTKIAEKTGVNRQALYTALSENGNPTLETLLKVMSALGIRLKCEAVEEAKAA